MVHWQVPHMCVFKRKNVCVSYGHMVFEKDWIFRSDPTEFHQAPQHHQVPTCETINEFDIVHLEICKVHVVVSFPSGFLCRLQIQRRKNKVYL